jgi:Zn-dependent protease with chaperone function
MNVWYGAAIAGAVLFIEGLVNILVNVRKKREIRSDAVRAASGAGTLIFAVLSIWFDWFRADISVEYSHFYAFASAGFVLMLESFISFLINVFTGRKRESGADATRAYVGGGIFLVGLIAILIAEG